MLKKIFSGICAGILIAIGGTIYLACDVKYIGAVLFSVALLCICLKGYSLYTGKIGFILESHDKESLAVTFLGLLGNAIGTIALGQFIRLAFTNYQQTALAMCETKLLQNDIETIFRGIMCGILMYLAVSIYKEKTNIVGILFCIPVFILSGFEHSIADIFYFSTSGIVSFRAFIFILEVILGNSVGAVILPLLSNTFKKKKVEKND